MLSRGRVLSGRLTMFPLMNISFIFQNLSPSADVWYTSLKVTFIKLSHSTK